MPMSAEVAKAIADQNVRFDEQALALAMEEDSIRQLESGQYDAQIERMMADENHCPRNPLVNP